MISLKLQHTPISLKSAPVTSRIKPTIMLPSKPDKKMEKFFPFSLLIALIKNADKRKRRNVLWGSHYFVCWSNNRKTGKIYENFNKWTSKVSFIKQRVSWKRRRWYGETWKQYLQEKACERYVFTTCNEIFIVKWWETCICLLSGKNRFSSN